MADAAKSKYEALMRALDGRKLAASEVALRSAQFGEAIRNTRAGRGISLAAFARLIGVTATMVGYLESGKRIWSRELADRALASLPDKRPEQWPDR